MAKSNTYSCLFIILFKCLIGTKCHRTKHSSLNSIVIHDNTVLLVIPRPTGNGKNTVHTIRHFTFSQIIVIHRTSQGHFSITEDVGCIVKPIAPVRRIDRNTLFGLRTRQLITRGLIMRRKRNQGRHHTQDSRGMDLHVSRLWTNVSGIICDKRLILFIRVHVFH